MIHWNITTSQNPLLNHLRPAFYRLSLDQSLFTHQISHLLSLTRIWRIHIVIYICILAGTVPTQMVFKVPAPNLRTDTSSCHCGGVLPRAFERTFRSSMKMEIISSLAVVPHVPRFIDSCTLCLKLSKQDCW